MSRRRAAITRSRDLYLTQVVFQAPFRWGPETKGKLDDQHGQTTPEQTLDRWLHQRATALCACQDRGHIVFCLLQIRRTPSSRSSSYGHLITPEGFHIRKLKLDENLYSCTLITDRTIGSLCGTVRAAYDYIASGICSTLLRDRQSRPR